MIIKNQNHIALFFIGCSLFFATSCKENKPKDEDVVIEVKESKEEILYRPNYHFTPNANWMNDPNGMFYLNGKYHLYFQYYPDGNVWGPMHWGHAISTDLIHWEEQPIALYPDDLGLIFSGSAVVDKNNTSGFGKDGIAPVVAIFTHHSMQGEKDGKLDFQTQSIAYSLDEGMTWTKYSDNPVISNPGIKDFRDPKVMWDTQTEKWIMSLAAGDKIMFYSSENLKDWELESEFGSNLGEHGGVWECPDLFPINVEGTEETKWVLLVSINPAGPNGGSATQYFVGDFNGKQFKVDSHFSEQLDKNEAVWLDYGRDNYAGVTWSNVPKSDGRTLFIGWMSNWDYARDVPTEKWRSTMTIPRELKLNKNNTIYTVYSQPVKELNNALTQEKFKDSITLEEFNKLSNNKTFNYDRLRLSLDLKDLKEEEYKLIFYNAIGDTLSLGLNNISKEYFVDRTKSGKTEFSTKFAPKVSIRKLPTSLNQLSIDLLLDKTSVEVFFNKGETVMTELFFPNAPLEQMAILSEDRSFSLESLKIEELKID